MTFRDQLFRCYRQSWYADAWKAYKEARRCIKQLFKNAECDHIRTEVQSHKDNPGSLRKIINTCIPSKEKETPVYSRNTELVANDFNQFFSFVGRNVAQTTAQLTVDNNINISDTCLISPPTTRNSFKELFNFTFVSCTQVERIVSSMPSNKSPGPDKVSMRITKTAFPSSLARWQTLSTVLSQPLHFQTPGKRLRSYHRVPYCHHFCFVFISVIFLSLHKHAISSPT